MNYFRRGKGRVVSFCSQLLNNVKALWSFLFKSQ